MVPHHAFVGADDAPKVAYLMHGVLGAGHNLRSLAKRLTERRPDYRFVLIDLRYHGKSKGAPPPHTIESCVDDLFDLSETIGRSPNVVIGHSLGGKVALGYGRRHEAPLAGQRLPTSRDTDSLGQVWTLDSDPGAQKPGGSNQVQDVVGALFRHPGPFPSRPAAIQAIESEGLSTGLANWLATSLDRKDAEFVWRFEMDHVKLLLADYFRLDLWPFLEEYQDRTRGRVRFDLLVAENSDRWSGSMRERADELNDSLRVQTHLLPDAGHWVHVDNPEGLIEILGEHLVR